MPQRNSGQRLVLILLRIVCYGALIAFAAAWLALEIIGWMGVCPQTEAVAVTCSSEAATWLRSTSMAVLVSAIFLGIPFLIGGLIFAIYDASSIIARWRRGSPS